MSVHPTIYHYHAAHVNMLSLFTTGPTVVDRRLCVPTTYTAYNTKYRPSMQTSATQSRVKYLYYQIGR